MKNDILRSYFQRKVSDLEKRYIELNSENKALRMRLEQYKTMILLKDKEIEELRLQIDMLDKSANESILDINVLNSRLLDELSEVSSIKHDLEKQMRDIIFKTINYSR